MTDDRRDRCPTTISGTAPASPMRRSSASRRCCGRIVTRSCRCCCRRARRARRRFAVRGDADRAPPPRRSCWSTGAAWFANAIRPSGWTVQSLAGAPSVAGARIDAPSRLPVGQVVTTDGASRARIDVGSIGIVDVEPNSRVRLITSRAGEHRMSLDRGQIRALHLGAAAALLRQHAGRHRDRSRLRLQAAGRRSRLGQGPRRKRVGGVRVQRARVVHPERRDVRDAPGLRPGHAVLRGRARPAFDEALTILDFSPTTDVRRARRAGHGAGRGAREGRADPVAPAVPRHAGRAGPGLRSDGRAGASAPGGHARRHRPRRRAPGARRVVGKARARQRLVVADLEVSLETTALTASYLLSSSLHDRISHRPMGPPGPHSHPGRFHRHPVGAARSHQPAVEAGRLAAGEGPARHRRAARSLVPRLPFERHALAVVHQRGAARPGWWRITSTKGATTSTTPSGRGYSSDDQDKFLGAMCSLTKRARMPLPSYLLIHRGREALAGGRHRAVHLVGQNAGYSPVDMSHLIFVPATAAPDAGDDVGKQTSLTLARLDEQLRAERSSLADAVVINVYLRRAADFPAMNEAYKQAFQAAPPTRTTVVVDPQHRGRARRDDRPSPCPAAPIAARSIPRRGCRRPIRIRTGSARGRRCFSPG